MATAVGSLLIETAAKAVADGSGRRLTRCTFGPNLLQPHAQLTQAMRYSNFEPKPGTQSESSLKASAFNKDAGHEKTKLSSNRSLLLYDC
jgi:hypothetical protein